METTCSPCQDIAAFEGALDQRADDLVRTVNALCADVRARNNERWESFSSLVNFPLIGKALYGLLRAPAGLEPEPKYHEAEWYKHEGTAIEEQAELLERMKAGHMEHWADEKVDAAFPWDHAGYYTAYHPLSPMKRSDAYKTYDIEGTGERLRVFAPKKYDFRSAAGGDKMAEGVFVLDSISRRVVALSDCNWSWEAMGGSGSTLLEMIHALIARSATVYTRKR